MPVAVAGSLADEESLGEAAVEAGGGDLVRRLLDLVLHAAEAERPVVAREHPAGARVAVARLADRADVDDHLPRADAVALPLLGGHVVHVVARVLEEDPGHVRVAEEAGAEGIHVALEDVERGLLVVDVVEVRDGRAVREEPAAERVRVGEPAEVLPALALLPLAAALLRLHALPRPESGPGGEALEVARDPEGDRLVVVALDHEVERAARDVDDGVRVGPVADHVAEADDLLHALALDVGEDGLERLEVRVEVGDEGDPLAQEIAPSARSMPRALASVSACSAAGCERRVTPPPTWPAARAPRTWSVRMSTARSSAPCHETQPSAPV